MRVCLLASVVVPTLSLLVLAATAQAQSQPSDKPRRLRVAVGVEAVKLLGDECVQGGDSTVCSPANPAYAFTFSGTFRVAPWLSLGGRFSAASKNTDAGGIHAPRHLSLWQVSFEPRVYPTGYTRVAPFIGLALGIGSLRQTSAEAPEKTSRSSLLIGGAAGVDFTLNDWLALSTEVRLLRMDFVPSSGAERNDGHSTYVVGQAWFSVGVQLVALLPV